LDRRGRGTCLAGRCDLAARPPHRSQCLRLAAPPDRGRRCMAILEMPMNTHLIAPIALITLSMCACTPQIGGGDSVSFRHISRIDATHIAVHARGDIADAVVSNEGDLAMDGKAIMLSPAQREDVRAYYMSAENLRKDALATGK